MIPVYSEEMLKGLVNECLAIGSIRLNLGRATQNEVNAFRNTIHRAVLKYTAFPVEILTIPGDAPGDISLCLRRYHAQPVAGTEEKVKS